MRPGVRRVALVALLLLAAAAVWSWLASDGTFGAPQPAGRVTPSRVGPEAVAARTQRVGEASRAVGRPESRQILFGDLHVHSTYSFDAYSISLPMHRGEGSRPPPDACDFARFCAELDFWSINDHAESITPEQWAQTKETVRRCNDAAGSPEDPDLVTFLGWEWTQIGDRPENHYGHKNVLLLDTADGRVPTRPIASRDQLFPGPNPYGRLMRLGLVLAAPGDRGRQPYHDFARFLTDRAAVPACAPGVPVRELPADCHESAATPTELFAKLDDWGFPYLVIPHGTTWGFYTPPLTSWDKQLAAHDDPAQREPLIEVFSGHGNTEAYRPWRALERGADGALRCPEPSPGYTPSCWRAGEIVRARCLEAGLGAGECEERAAQARSHYVAAGEAGHMTVPGAEVEDWLDAGQCTDCYMPAYDYRPGGSVQYGLARRDFTTDSEGKRFRFGLIASSDVHTARPGTGYKEIQRRRMTDAGLGNLGPPKALLESEPEPRSIAPGDLPFESAYFERFASFFGTGGLVAVHSSGRDRHAIWEALRRKETHATSGDRILLWFDLVDGDRRLPMGTITRRRGTPRFEVRALGAFEQKPGCPDSTLTALTPDRLERLCGGECYHPSDERRPIERIEVVRIRPQLRGEKSLDGLIEDPWKTLPCPADGTGCVASFEDPSFEALGRDVVYYVRALQAPTPTVNAANLRCTGERDAACEAVEPCRAGPPTDYDDDCTAPEAERAWSSPIFVDWDASAAGPQASAAPH